MSERTSDGRRREKWLLPVATIVGRALRRARQLDLPEIIALALLGLCAFAIWAFAEIADEVAEAEIEAFDRAVLLLFRNPKDLSDPIGPYWLEELLRDFTAFGGVGVLVLVTLAVSGYLALHRKRRLALLVLAAVGSGLLASTFLKSLFDRPRPELVPHGVHVYSASFPSGHSMMSAVTWLTLAALLARVQPSWRLRILLLLVAAGIVFLVGASRVYLGVHWPTDVLAGWTAGTAWAILWSLLVWRLQRRGIVER